MKLLRISAAAPLFAVALWAADSVGNGITTPESLFPQLDAILAQAAAQSPTMLARAVDEEIAENDAKVARAGLLPNIGGYYRFQKAEDKRADRPGQGRIPTDKVYYDFSLTQPIFHWGDKKNNDRIGQMRLALTQQNYREAYRVLADSIRTGYLRLINDKLKVTRAAYYNTLSQAVLKRSEERLEAKAISDAQMFGIRTDAERAQINEDRTRLEFDDSKRSFARLTGMPELRDEEIPDDIPAVVDNGAAVQAALAGFLAQSDPQTAAALVAKKQLEIEQRNLTITRTRLLPKLNFQVGINQDEQSYTVNVAQRYSVNSLYYGLSVSWTIFDGFAAGAAERSSRARIRQYERDYRSLTEQLGSKAQFQAKMAGIYARYCKINDTLVNSGEGNLATKKDDFARGANSEDDVNQAQLNLYDTRLLAFAARQDYYNQLVDFLGTVAEDPVLNHLPPK